MIRRTVWSLGLVASVLSGCARHVVVERDVGRVDGDRSISTSSEGQWTIQHYPSTPAEGEETP
jgi:hypothetical protein